MERAMSLPKLVPRHLGHAVGVGSQSTAQRFRDSLLILYIAVSNILLMVLWWALFSMIEARSSPLLFVLWTVAFMGWGTVYAVGMHRMRPEYRAASRDTALLICGTLLTVVSGNVAYALHTPGPVLKDVGFMLVPRISRGSLLATFADAGPLYAAGLLFSRSIVTQDVRALAAWSRCLGIMYFIRSVTVWNTMLPGPADHCSYDSPRYMPPTRFTTIMSHMSFIWGSTITCGDLLFSGHTAWTLLSLLLNYHYFPRSHPRLRSFMVFISVILFSLFTIGTLGLRKHYTTDMTLAIVISVFIYKRFRNGWAAADAHRAADEVGSGAILPTRKDSSDVGAPAGPLHKSRSYHMV